MPDVARSHGRSVESDPGLARPTRGARGRGPGV